MITLNNIGVKRGVSGIVIFLLIVSLFVPMSGLTSENAYAAEESFSSYEVEDWVKNTVSPIDSTTRHSRNSDGSVSYCISCGKALPDGHAYGDYQPDPAEASKMQAALTYGYPNVTNIEGYYLSDDQARCATQLVAWAIRGAFDLNDLSPAIAEAPEGGTNVIAASKALFLRAQAGYTQIPAVVNLPEDKRPALFSNAYLRIGPFSTENAVSVSAEATGASSGSYFGDSLGAQLSQESIPANSTFYYYVSRNALTAEKIKISVEANYCLNKVTYYQTASEKPQDMITHETGYTDKVSGSISIIQSMGIELEKFDAGTNAAKPQADASLANAVYGIFAAENMYYPDGGVAYAKNQLVSKLTTDKNGKSNITGLVPLNYYVKEITPPKGYLLDENKYPANGTNGSETTVIQRKASSKEIVMKQAFELIKVGVTEGESEAELLTAGFKVYLISELSAVKAGKLSPAGGAWAGADFKGYDFKNENTAKIDGGSTSELFTNAKGFLRSPELPFGDYVVVESTVPKGKKAITPFIVSITGDNRTPQAWRVMNDEEPNFHLRIVKKDSDTGNPVMGKSAKYRIYDIDDEKWVTMKTTYPEAVLHGTKENPFATDSNGSLITPQKLKYGKYKIVEVEAPEGYVLAGHEQIAKDESIVIDFDENQPMYFADADEAVIEVVQFNEQQKGCITIEKTGDVRTGIAHKKNGDVEVIYENRPLAGAVFQIVAAGPVMAQDGSGEVVFSEGDVCRTLITDEEGHAFANDLPIGDFVLREVEAPENYLIAEDTPFSISATNQEEAIIYQDFKIDDELIKPQISCEVDKDTIRTTSSAYRSLPKHEGIDNVGLEKYRYDIDFRSTSNIYCEEFVVGDPLEGVSEGKVRLLELWTPIVWGDMNGLFNIWVKTNKTDDKKTYSSVNAMADNPENPENVYMKAAYPNKGFRLWKQDVAATGREHLDVKSLGLSKGEYVTELRFEFGAVEVGFTSKNYSDVSLNGEHRSRAWVHGNFVDWTPEMSSEFYAEGAASAAGLRPATYMVAANKAMSKDVIKSSVTARIARDFELRDMDMDDVRTNVIKTFTYEEKPIEEKPIVTPILSSMPAKTGDDSDTLFWIMLAGLTGFVGVMAVYLKRRMENA
ncbi:MAG: Cys-Gln thioester bond-forming surface protein [Clostridiales Family XIII bacterium]|jgi:hypothetical protein|nr:Cys-Gln thioester bond-forming surface protein [Clostridiales Family XIII bacterium]